MNPACWSSRREVGALWGISASFTITAIVASTLKWRRVTPRSTPLKSIPDRAFEYMKKGFSSLSPLEFETGLSFHVSCSPPSVSPVTSLEIWCIVEFGFKIRNAPELRESWSYFPIWAQPASEQHNACIVCIMYRSMAFYLPLATYHSKELKS